LICKSSKKHSFDEAATWIVCEHALWADRKTRRRNEKSMILILLVLVCARIVFGSLRRNYNSSTGFNLALHLLDSPALSFIRSPSSVMADNNEQVNVVSVLVARPSPSIHRSNRLQDDHDPHYDPVIRLTEQVETKTHEEDEDVFFKM
jgi:hypothetical protein